MMNNKYIIFLYYEYNHKSDIINIDNKCEKLINMTNYDKKYKFFSPLDSRRYFVVSIYSPHIFKLIKITRFPLIIESIMKVLKTGAYNKDEYGFTSIDLNYKANNTISDDTHNYCLNDDFQIDEYEYEYNDYQINKYTNYFVKDIYLCSELFENLNISEKNHKMVRIYGIKYDDIVPMNFQLTEDLTIYVSLKTR